VDAKRILETALICAPQPVSVRDLRMLFNDMLGAFFIATDPVTAATTPRGRLLFGALIGALVFIIRHWGGYPDGVAFAVLLANICTPLLDSITRPAVYGTRSNSKGG
jgi:electron transport complex protein RnfD